MSFMRNFHWQDNRGFTLIFSTITIPLFLILCFSCIRFSRFIERKIKLQNGLDAAMLSGIALLCEGLNQISELNKKLEYYHRLYALARAGTLIHRGVKISELFLRSKIEAIALKQDLIKLSYPLLAAQKIYDIAKKNETPHLILSPFQRTYAIEREPPRNGLPNVYRLSHDFENRKSWSGFAYYYRGSYRANSKGALYGTDLFDASWRGYIIE